MRKRTWCLAMVLSLFLMLFVASSSWAQITSLHVARGSTGNLYANWCSDGGCGGFTQISGNFAAQPALSYDPAWGRFVLIGVSGTGQIWRSTFDGVSGAFNNDWTIMAGTSNSPIASAGGATVLGWAKINADGSIDSCLNCLAGGTGRISAGGYEVDFTFDITNTPRAAVLDTQTIGTVTGEIGVANRVGDNSSVYVGTTNSAGTDADQPFTLVIFNW